MRLLQVVTDDDRRGAQVFARALGERLAQEGIEVRTVALAPGAVGGLDVEVLGRRPWLQNLARLRRAVKPADVVLAHGSSTLPACALAGLATNRPLVYRQVSDPAYWTPTFGRRLRTTTWYRRVTRTVALSPSVAEVLAERFHIARHRISVIPNGVDERRWRVATTADRETARRDLLLRLETPVVGVIGSLTAEKGVADLIPALHPAWCLLVVGDGPERAALERQAAASRVTARFVGFMEDPWQAVAATDVVALPSRSDMHPAVALESALVGRPVVATDVGAVRDLVLDGVTGRVVPPADRDALTSALAGLLADPDLRDGMAVEARRNALEHHSLTALAPKWLDLLRGVVQAR